MLSFIYSAHF